MTLLGVPMESELRRCLCGVLVGQVHMRLYEHKWGRMRESAYHWQALQHRAPCGRVCPNGALERESLCQGPGHCLRCAIQRRMTGGAEARP